ncbi:MAG: cupin domain-containing protein [Nitrosopumilus sp. H8]|nr:MAG: cupin domain-containing protein [Nitrosopumilus sp. H13]RNJ79091.1 MAG: cupin domain-containing protein [Nitrosopumilus sp. H8]
MKLEFDVLGLADRLKSSSSYFDTFINKESLAAGVLVLQPGEEDTQEPHDADEVYYVVSGDGFLRINKKDYAVSGGKAFFVSKGTKHRFHGNKKELRAVYFFGGQDS